jgi:hypothetical protein
MPFHLNYAKSMFYQLVCRDPSITERYVGFTTNKYNRLQYHIEACTDPQNIGYGFKVYKFIRNHGGFDNWEMRILEVKPCKDKFEARRRERYWVEELKAELNSQVPGRTSKEACHSYYLKHREALAAKEKIRGSLRVKCACGSVHAVRANASHARTKKHVKWLEDKASGI